MSDVIPLDPAAARPPAVEHTVIVWAGPPAREDADGLPGLRKGWEGFQLACEADRADAWANHPWARLQRGIHSTTFGSGPGGLANLEDLLSEAAGCRVRVEGHSIDRVRFRDLWTVAVIVTLSAAAPVEFRGEALAARLRGSLGGLFGILWFAEWVAAAVSDGVRPE